MKPDNQVGDYRLSRRDAFDKDPYPYGLNFARGMIPVQVEINGCIGIVRAALKKAKANL